MTIKKKKPGHFNKSKDNKTKKDKRGVLSFEELPLDSYDEPSKKRKKIKLNLKRILIAVLIIILLVVSVLLYFNRGSVFNCSGNSGFSSYSASVSGTTVDGGNFRLFSSGLCYSSDTHIVSLDRDGNEQYSIQHGFTTPVLKTKGSKAIAYDLGLYNFTILGENGKEFSSNLQNKIHLADITDKGEYAFVTEVKDYNAKFSAFNAMNKIKYAYSFSDYHITSMALNSLGDNAVVCGVTADNGLPQSVIYVLDFLKEEPVAKHIISDDIIYDCDFLSDGTVCAIGRENAYICNSDNFENIKNIPFNSMTLKAYDFNSDIGVAAFVVSRSGDGSNCNIIYVNADGKTEKVIETDYSIHSISIYKDRIAVSDANNVYLYSNLGEQIKSTECSSVKQIRLCTANGVYILGLNDISGVEM